MRLLNNRYQLIEPLGKGGMAVVYRAQDLMLARQVAIKVLRADYSTHAAFQERFRQEARAAANLSHPNIVTVHDFGMDDGQLFLVMEFVRGMDLKSMIRRRAPFSAKDTVDLMIQACAGLGYAHRAGLVHCDVKPHNLLVSPDMRLKVTDFGIARALSTIRSDERSDVVWGSPLYFSPEQAAGLPPSPASDVYSLGVIMYEMLSGRLPFEGNSAEDLIRQHRDELPPPIMVLVPDLPPALGRIVHKVLAKEPSARYRTADQLGRVLMTLRRGLENETSTPAPQPKAVRPKARPQPKPAPVKAARTVTPPPAASTPPRPAAQTEPPKTYDAPLSEPETLDIDWVSILLGLVALAAVGGLIPFWMWVYFVYNPPVR